MRIENLAQTRWSGGVDEIFDSLLRNPFAHRGRPGGETLPPPFSALPPCMPAVGRAISISGRAGDGLELDARSRPGSPE
jgi:hypothetical protein